MPQIIAKVWLASALALQVLVASRARQLAAAAANQDDFFSRAVQPSSSIAYLDDSILGKHVHLAASPRSVSSGTAAARATLSLQQRRPKVLQRRYSTSPVAAALPQNSRPPIEIIHAAAKKGGTRPPPMDLLNAIVAQNRLPRRTPGDSCTFFESLAGGGSPGRRWRLVYAAGKDAVVAARKSRKESVEQTPTAWMRGLAEVVAPWTKLKGGVYLDDYVTAIQRFDAEKLENENGIFAVLGADWVRFTVLGPFKWPKPVTRNLCAFRPTSATIALGGWSNSWSLEADPGTKSLFSTSPAQDAAVADLPFEELPVNKLPFFKFIHVDDKVALAIGRSGGAALWARME
eukprot:gnl/TRDRNA2_/TRDRNA2_204084_c0_seq1.p1 gnl/TRDRNA2_/TRDRNA2_204084_c0~~gnl/TRDRNA2_/TRDRNA2_204084_c0_seq1.p1  ORF type:complete len:346 (+),score=53.19 gnl/TRDRNA2_/TRDRNA2_204084_c0_seq1:99-1136(+)